MHAFAVGPPVPQGDLHGQREAVRFQQVLIREARLRRRGVEPVARLDRRARARIEARFGHVPPSLHVVQGHRTHRGSALERLGDGPRRVGLELRDVAGHRNLEGRARREIEGQPQRIGRPLVLEPRRLHGRTGPQQGQLALQ